MKPYKCLWTLLSLLLFCSINLSANGSECGDGCGGVHIGVSPFPVNGTIGLPYNGTMASQGFVVGPCGEEYCNTQLAMLTVSVENFCTNSTAPGTNGFYGVKIFAYPASAVNPLVSDQSKTSAEKTVPTDDNLCELTGLDGVHGFGPIYPPVAMLPQNLAIGSPDPIFLGEITYEELCTPTIFWDGITYTGNDAINMFNIMTSSDEWLPVGIGDGMFMGTIDLSPLAADTEYFICAVRCPVYICNGFFTTNEKTTASKNLPAVDQFAHACQLVKTAPANVCPEDPRIPTIGQWGLFILMLMLSSTGLIYMRRRSIA